MKVFYFLAGLPRSGSTLLASILNQNPDIYVSPTSPLLPILMHTEKSWSSISEAQASSPEVQFQNINSAIIQGCYQHIEKPIVIDKGRGWPANIAGVKKAFGIEPKIICTMRDIAEVVASFMYLMQKDERPLSYLDEDVFKLGLNINNENRALVMWEQYIKRAWIILKEAYQDHPENLHLVEYYDTINKPKETLQGIYQFLGLEEFMHDYENIENVTPEKDEFWRLSNLHAIRPKLKKTSPPAPDILGKDIYQRFVDMDLEFWRT